MATPEGTAYLTSAHALVATSKPKSLLITFRCNSLVIKKPVIALEILPGIDVGIIYPESAIPEMPTFTVNAKPTRELYIPHYPNLSALDPNLTDIAMEFEANLVKVTDAGRIYFSTSMQLRQGASGSPILDRQGQVIGIVAARLLEKENYAGIGYGDIIIRVQAALAARKPTLPSASSSIDGRVRASESGARNNNQTRTPSVPTNNPDRGMQQPQ